MARIIFGSTRLSLSYIDEELYEMVSSYIDGTKDEFTYIGVCNFIRERAKKENKFQKEDDTEYSDIELLPSDASRISKALWQKIWNKEIFIDLNKDIYRGHYARDTIFCKNL